MRSPNENEIREWLDWILQDVMIFVDGTPYNTREVKWEGNTAKVIFNGIPHKRYIFVYQGEEDI